MVTVHDLKAVLGDFPDDYQVYVVSGDGLEHPKVVEAFMDPEIEKELPEEDRIGKFLLITAKD